MYQRKNPNGILPTTGNGSSYSSGTNYRPSYPVPPSYASGMSSQSSSFTSQGSKSRKRTIDAFSFIPQWAFYVVIVCLLFVIMFSRAQVMKWKGKAQKLEDKLSRLPEKDYSRNRRKDPDNFKEMQRVSKELEKAQSTMATQNSQIKTQKQRMLEMETEKYDLIQELEDHQKHHHGDSKGEKVDENPSDSSEIVEKYEKREETLYERIQSLQDKIQRESYREVKERFGEGPYFVQFNIILPEEVVSDQFPELGSFVIQLATIDQMPHSIHLFLEQVQHNLWADCAIIINAPHILQIGPHSFSTRGDKLKPFKDLYLDKLAFQEYNETFPHEKYTIGFAGRPSGPDFYINKINNVNNHGPGGQGHHVLDEEADPCFAKVVEGFDLVDMIFGMKTRGAQNIMKDEVVIESVNLLGSNYKPSGLAVIPSNKKNEKMEVKA